jgi:hypothetical protein
MEVLIREASVVSAVLDYFVRDNVLTTQGKAFVGATVDIVNVMVQFLAYFSANILV